MADKKNLCAQIDIALHNRVTEEKDRLEMTTSQYIASLLTEYYKMKDENGGINMTGSRTIRQQHQPGSDGLPLSRGPGGGAGRAGGI